MNDVSRRDVLKGILAVTITPTILSFERAAELAELELPAKTPVWMPTGGVDFEGALNSVCVLPSLQVDKLAQVWLTRADDMIVSCHYFNSMTGFMWNAGPLEAIQGPINVQCSCEADFLLTGLDGAYIRGKFG